VPPAADLDKARVYLEKAGRGWGELAGQH
jgi:hypothetical protein